MTQHPMTLTRWAVIAAAVLGVVATVAVSGDVTVRMTAGMAAVFALIILGVAEVIIRSTRRSGGTA